MKKDSQLVCQHLENISREALKNYQEIVRKYIRGRQGVYALYRRGDIYYVGLARNLRNRLKTHIKDQHGQSWDRFSVYLTIGDQHLHELEALILRIVKPSGNKQKGTFANSEDLRTRFRRDIKLTKNLEIEQLFSTPGTDEKISGKPTDSIGRKAVMANFSKTGMKLKATFKGKLLWARALRDGRIRFGGKSYFSPSVAAAAACKRKTCNGWTFWRYERAPGDWIILDNLRH